MDSWCVWNNYPCSHILVFAVVQFCKESTLVRTVLIAIDCEQFSLIEPS